jgi:hypothetical protein
MLAGISQKEPDTESFLCWVGHGAFAQACPAETRVSAKNRPNLGRVLGACLTVPPLTKSPS